MKQFIILFLFSIFMGGNLLAGPGDTIVVQTLTFSDITKRRDIFQFPDTTHSYRKVLLYYTLKCDPATTQDGYGCGEWDYSSYNYIYDHTGHMDSNSIQQSNFVINGTSPDTLLYVSSPTYTFYKNWQYFTVYDNVISETNSTIGTGSNVIDKTLQSQLKTAKSQYLWTQSEMLSAGLVAGSIDKIKLNISTLGSSLDYLTVSMKHSSLTQLSPSTYETNLQKVFEYNTTFATAGINTINFTSPFIWDGVSNIVIEFSYNNPSSGSNHVILGDTTSLNSGIYSTNMDYYLSFNNADYVEVPTSSLASLDSAITVSFWQYGDPNLQPQNDFIFQGVDNNNNRVFSSHLPWGNGNVYWDAGNDGGTYDRIFNSCAAIDFKGKWNHWAFTKDVNTGSMKIYINGALWFSGTGKTKDMSGITKFKIGSNTDGSVSYDGFINDFRVWNTALDQATISAWMNKDIDASHPNYNNLLAYYKFDEESGLITSDSSTNNNNAVLFGLPERQAMIGSDIFRNLEASNQRPNITMVQGNYVSHLDSVLVVDSVMNNAISVLIYNDSTIAPLASDTLLIWQQGYSYVYENGIVIDSIYTASSDTLINYTFTYFSDPYEVINRYEIGRYITPYGINLDLGAAGFRWVYDITDYAHFLHDNVDFQAGSQSELIDCKFIMIEGAPARELVQIDRIWGVNRDHLYKNLANNTDLFATTIKKHLNSSSYQVKTRITGHGHNSTNGNYPHCCEWKDNTHYLYVDNTLVDSWHIFLDHDCALNPVFPQGGTWPGAREGWCPGDVVKDIDFEVTSFTTGDSITVDYDITDVPANNVGMGNGRYLMAMHLMQYGPTNYALDAEIYDVITPNNWKYYSRKNPVCSDPKIIIRNSGSTPLTSLKITYGVSGGTNKVYNWTGNLGFMEKAEVNLPVDLGSFWVGDGDNIFTATVSNPNGGQDANSLNDNFHSPFTLPDIYSENFIIVLRTNNIPSDNRYEIKDIAGNVVLSRNNFTASTFYYDTLNLPQGCYELSFYDDGDDGLSYWAYSAQGTGYLRLKNASGTYLKLFESEFGNSIHYAFTIGNIDHINKTTTNQDILVFPNPSNGVFTLDMVGIEGETKIEISNSMGAIISSKTVNINNSFSEEIDLRNRAKGIYFIKITNGEKTTIKKLITQ